MSESWRLAVDEVFEISEDRVMRVAWSEEELDGISFGQDEGGVTVIYVDGVWTLNLFLIALAWEMGPDIEPKLDGYQRIFHTAAMLMMGISEPYAAPHHGPKAVSYKLPAIRILWKQAAGALALGGGSDERASPAGDYAIGSRPAGEGGGSQEVSAEDRIARALSLIDTWLHDVSDNDDMLRRAMWNNVREVRAALDGGSTS